MIQGPHQSQPLLQAGESNDQAKAAMVMMHGRGATAKDILELVSDLEQPGFTYLAPQAAGNAWYLEEAAIPIEHTIILGFSQGACLTLEFVARNARRYGGVVGLSGGLIGPDSTSRDYPGTLAGTPIFLGCSDKDPFVPKERVEFSATIMQKLGGDVTAKLYPNLAHTVNPDEIRSIRTMMVALTPEK